MTTAAGGLPPPHNLEAEKSVLGAILVQNEAFPHAAALIGSHDFYRDAHRRIFDKMAALRARETAIDFVTLRDELGRAGELEDVGGPAYIASLADGVPRSANIIHYANIVKIAAQARTLIAYAQQAIDTFTADPGAIGNGLGARFAEAVRRTVDEAHAAGPADAFSEPIAIVAARTAAAGPREMLIDGLIARGEIALVHGEPRTLKTYLQLAMAIALTTGTTFVGLPTFTVGRQRRVLYCTGEDPEVRIVERIRSILAGLGFDALPDDLRLRCSGGLWLDDPTTQRRLVDEVKAEGIDLVILEPLRTLSAAVDQGPRELQPLAGFIRHRLIGDTGCAVVLGHHDVKPQAGVTDQRRRAHRASGGGLFAIADAPIHVEALSEGRVLVTPNSFKHAETPASFIVTREQTDGAGVQLVGATCEGRSPEGIGLQERVLEYLKHNPGKPGSAVAAGLRARKDDVLGALQQLNAAERVDSIQQGRALRWFLKGGAA